MKRSEMIEIMIAADKDQSSCRSLYHTFSHILKAIEDAGMLPPSAIIVANEMERQYNDDSYFCNKVNDWVIEDNQWEPETSQEPLNG